MSAANHEGGRRDVEQDTGPVGDPDGRLAPIKWPDDANGAILLHSGASLSLGIDKRTGAPHLALTIPGGEAQDTTMRESELRALVVLTWSVWSRYLTRRDRAASRARGRGRHAPSPGKR